MVQRMRPEYDKSACPETEKRQQTGPELLIAGFTFATGARVWAQEYPNRQIRFIVPFTLGGSIDIVARIVAKELSENWKVRVSVDNRPGAGGNIGTELAAKSSPDGYSILLCVLPHAVYPSLYRNRTYDPLRDLVPITLAASFYLVLSVHPSVPIRSVREFVELAKRRPGEISYGTAGVGSPPHLAGEMMRMMTGISMAHVPYAGNPQSQLDLMSGDIQMLFINLANALPLMKAERIRGLAITSARRS